MKRINIRIGSGSLLCMIAFLFLFSCYCKREITSERLAGQWAIKEITYLGKSYRDQLLLNAFTLDKDNNAYIPRTVHFDEDHNARWELIKDTINNKLLVKIKTKNTVFNDTFRIHFIADEEKQLRGVELKSDTIYIKAFKLLQNFNRW